MGSPQAVIEAICPLEPPPFLTGDVFIQSAATSGFSYIGCKEPETVDGFVTVGDVGYLDAGGACSSATGDAP